MVPPPVFPVGAVTVTWSATSRATVLPSALSSRVTVTVLTALTMGSSARGLVSTTIRSRTGPGGRSSAKPGRLGQRVTGCSACGVPSALLSTRRPPRLACSKWSVRPALYSRQSKVSSQVRRCVPLPAAPGSSRTVNACDSALRTAVRSESSPAVVSATNSRRPVAVTWRLLQAMLSPAP